LPVDIRLTNSSGCGGIKLYRIREANVAIKTAKEGFNTVITKIDIRNTATFGDATPSLDGLKKINFFFGANGTGKTTISKVIADSEQFSECTIA
jgi:predicted ATPase